MQSHPLCRMYWLVLAHRNTYCFMAVTLATLGAGQEHMLETRLELTLVEEL